MLVMLLETFFLTFFLTWVIRRYALANKVLDIPNYRSSHSIPTPRGGGLAFVIAFFLSLLPIYYWQFINGTELLVFYTAGLVIAVLGFVDDHMSVKATRRLLIHFLASAVAVYLMHGMGTISVAFWEVPAANLVLSIFAVFYLAWMINLYNFMDGIDGLAALEAITVGCAIAFIYWVMGDYYLTLLPLALAAAVAGFLCWNFPPARIFMGDGGSGFLGFCLGVMSIQASKYNANYFWIWLILLGVFIVDASFTLCRRALNGKKLYQAHRSHAYQQAVGFYPSHLFVTMSIFCINLLWLLPLAILVAFSYLPGILGLFIAYVPLVLFAWLLQAGKDK